MTIKDPINKVEHSLRFATSEVTELPEDFSLDIVDEATFISLVSVDGKHILDIPIEDIILDNGDARYYCKIKEFLRGMFDV